MKNCKSLYFNLKVPLCSKCLPEHSKFTGQFTGQCTGDITIRTQHEFPTALFNIMMGSNKRSVF